MHEALFWSEKNDSVHCSLCHRNCSIKENSLGFCGVRKNVGGKLYTLNYGKACSYAVDPIEKKPFYHFYPGELTLSIAARGCNFRCPHCFTMGTFVMTDSGVQLIEQLASDFKGKSLLTHSGKFMKINNSFKHFYSGIVCKVKPMYLPEIICTPDHKFLVTTDPVAGKIQKVEARALNNKHFVMIPRKTNVSPIRLLDVKAILSKVTTVPFKIRRRINSDLIRNIKEMKANGFTSRQIGKEISMNPAYVRNLFTKISRRSLENLLGTIESGMVEKEGRIRFKNERCDIPSHLEVTPELARVLGLYCAEGCTRKSSKRPNASDTVFSFGPLESAFAEEVKSICKVLFDADAIIIKCKTSLQVCIPGISVSRLFESLCGNNCKSKKVPFFIFNSTPEIVGSFLKGYFDGDGCFKDRYSDAITVSKGLAIGVFELFLSQGIVPGFYEYTPPEKKVLCGRVVNQSRVYIVRVPSGFDFIKGFWKKKSKVAYFENKQFFFVPLRSVSELFYDGNVYNFDVDLDHTYTANFVSVCNCQNYEISQCDCDEKELPPEKIVSDAERLNSRIISYTYTEPTIFYEYARDTGVLVRKKGMLNTFVTNGYIQTAPIKDAAKNFLDAVRIDLKGEEDHYKRIAGNADFNLVLQCIRDYYKTGIHLEIVTLVIPGENDNKQFVSRISEFLTGLGKEGRFIPWHFTQFHPDYLDREHKVTPIKTLEKMRDWAKDAGMQYVYTGNISHEYNNTHCHNCSELLIRRDGFGVAENRIEKGKCPDCGAKIPVVI